LDKSVGLHDLPYDALRSKLLEDGQILEMNE
jgi:hypothetical protein